MSIEEKARPTPGPWQIVGAVTDPWQIAGRDGGRGNPRVVLCELTYTGGNAEANARLIAASPVMYEFIKRKAEEGDKDAAELIASI